MTQSNQDLTRYDWWGGPTPPPDHLKTRSQLAELGLSPVKPVGFIPTKKYDCFLYDSTDVNSAKPKRKMSTAQLEALAKSRCKQKFDRLYKDYKKDFKSIDDDRIQAVNWAKDRLNSSVLILDTETTGLSLNAQMVEIAVIDTRGQVLIDSLCQPSGEWSMEDGTSSVHGISMGNLKNAPTFAELYPQLVSTLQGQEVLIYNAEFDDRILKYGCEVSGLPLLGYWSECLMRWYSQWCGEWSSRHNSYRFQALGGGHRALSDCRAALERLTVMAADSDQRVYPDWLKNAAMDAGVDLE